MRSALPLRQRRRLIGGAAILGVGVVVLSWPEPPPAPVQAPAPPIATAVSPAAVAALLPVAPLPVAASTSGLQLRGVLGYSGGPGSAIFGLPDGRQRLVAVGREVTPGVRLEAIGVDRATVHDGVQRLDFMLPELQAVGGPPLAAGQLTTPTPTPSPTPPAVDPKRDLANFRLGLKPEGDPERPRGYRIAGGVPLPILDRAGLKAGDVVLAVNGQTLDEERLLELPAELLAATSVEIDYERAGKRQRATVPTR